MFLLKRSFSDRRSGKDRRRTFGFLRHTYKGPERRQTIARDRRSIPERRKGYVRIGRWSSVKLQDLKLARYLQHH